MTDHTRTGAGVRVRQLEAFQAVAQTGSFTRAAALLGVSQPAVSRLVRDLGASVGVPLFARDGGAMVPTQEARYLLSETGRVLEALSGFEKLTRELQGQPQGRLRITCLPGFATVHLPSVLARFLSQREGVFATLEPDRPERILDWIVAENCDIGLTADFEGHAAVTRTRVQVRTVCVLPPGHPLAARDEITPHDLRGERLIHARRDEPFCRSLMRAFDEAGVQPRSTVETRQFSAACRMVAEGFGVTVVSELDAREYLHTGIAIRPFWPRVPHNLDILLSRLSPQSVLALEFVEAFVESLADVRLER